MNDDAVDAREVVEISNVQAPELSNRGERLLALDYAALAPGRVGRVGTAVFVPSAAVSEHFEGPGYNLFASPQLYSGQTIRAACSRTALMQAPSMSALRTALQP